MKRKSAVPRMTSARLPIAVRNSSAVDRAVEDHPRRDAGPCPDERARAVVEEKRDEPGIDGPRQRRRHGREAGHEFRDHERRQSPLLENRRGLPDAGIRRERDAAQGLQDLEAVALSERVPEGIRDERGENGHEEDAGSGEVFLHGQGAGDHQNRDRGDGQAQLLEDNIDEDE
jgi:hypothetical protein